ncbi:MAG TPA: alpha-galactosidase, partial [Leptospiraceae bacterium]|nr:alpha-galactosidase [Leptospiraceae bacterium]
DQTILMASVMGLSGGMLLISDNLSTLDTERMPLFHKAVAISRACQAESSKPLGLMEYKFPRGIYNPGGAAGFWNPTEEAAEISVYYPYPLFWENKPEFWTSATFRDYEYDKVSRTLKLRLGPFQSVVFIK